MITCRGRLPKAFARTLAARGFRRLTPVQRAVLRIEEEDRDVLVSAGTGSGKTVAFGLMLARRLTGAGGRMPWAAGPQAIVVTPTRELAMQVRGELAWLFAGGGARIGCCTGGSDQRAERAALAAGLDIVVGTPGRLGAHLRLGALKTGHVACVVLDEADRMLGADFRAELEAVLSALPEGRQTMMFSATVSAEVEQLARRFQRDALRLDLDAARGLELEGVAVAPADREAAVVNLLRLHEARAAIVFCARRDSAGALAERLAARGFAVAGLSGAMSQAGRNAALAALREGRARVCVATDLAARGFDLPGLDLVLHAELPGSAEVLLHRSGRTGRAGQPGLAVLVVTPRERRRAETLAERAGLTIAWRPAPDQAAVAARDLERMLAAAGAEPEPAEIAAAARLLAALTPERIAAAYRRLWVGGRPLPAALPRR